MIQKIKLYSIILLLILFSCNIFESEEEVNISADFSLTFSTARTINSTSYNTDFYYYVIKGLDSESNSIYEVIYSDSGTISGLTADTWEFSITAYDQDNNSLAYGENTVEITNGSSNNICITMEYNQINSGDVEITINWPEDISTEYLIATIVDPSDKTTTYGTYDVDLDDYIDVSTLTSYTFSVKDVESGSSTLFLKFYSAEEVVLFSVVEAISVYDNLTTAEEINITEDDIGIPDAPTNIVVGSVIINAGYDDTIYISWDSVTNADYYQVYYSYEPLDTVLADSGTVDLTSYFTATDEYYYQQSYTNSEALEIEIPTAGDNYINSYVNDNSSNLYITFTVSAINDYGETISEPLIYITEEY